MCASEHNRDDEEQASPTSGAGAASLSPTQAIGQYCRRCAENRSELRDCRKLGCPAWGWRFGRRPQTALKQGRVTQEQLDEWLARLRSPKQGGKSPGDETGPDAV